MGGVIPMQNAKCKMQSAKCKMQSAKCKVQRAAHGISMSFGVTVHADY
jgi:hypothetical protein